MIFQMIFFFFSNGGKNCYVHNAYLFRQHKTQHCSCFCSALFQSLCQELEAKFYEGTFNWEMVKQHDAASLLKLFIRELPQPLLTVEYLKAFQDVQCKQHCFLS